MAGPPKERKAFLLRIDPALWVELERWADDELRSVNGQIEMILRQAIQKRKGARREDEPEQVKARPSTKWAPPA